MDFDVKETEGQNIILSMKGAAEAVYEKFDLYLDGELIVRVQADNTSICQVSTCNMCEVHMPEQRLHLVPGQHHIKITVDTIDNSFHNNAYFRIEFEVAKPKACYNANDVSCSCPLPGKKLFLRFSCSKQ